MKLITICVYHSDFQNFIQPEIKVLTLDMNNFLASEVSCKDIFHCIRISYALHNQHLIFFLISNLQVLQFLLSLLRNVLSVSELCPSTSEKLQACDSNTQSFNFSVLRPEAVTKVWFKLHVKEYLLAPQHWVILSYFQTPGLGESLRIHTISSLNFHPTSEGKAPKQEG